MPLGTAGLLTCRALISGMCEAEKRSSFGTSTGIPTLPTSSGRKRHLAMLGFGSAARHNFGDFEVLEPELASSWAQTNRSL